GSGLMPPDLLTTKGKTKALTVSLRARHEVLAARGHRRVGGCADAAAGVDLVGVQQHLDAADGQQPAAGAGVRRARADRVLNGQCDGNRLWRWWKGHEVLTLWPRVFAGRWRVLTGVERALAAHQRHRLAADGHEVAELVGHRTLVVVVAGA